MKLADWLVVCIAGLVQGRAVTSTDGTCGGDSGVTCLSSIYGNCCSKDGFCGATFDACGAGCQLDFGLCEKTEGTVSQDGTCGDALGYTCEGSIFGDCCSQYGFCGQTNAYCGEGCRSDLGKCGAALEERAAASSSLRATGAAASSSVRAQPSSQPTNNSQSSGQGGGACAAKRSSSQVASRDNSCIRCEGQPGNDQFCGYDIHTDYYKYAPKTCKTVEYTFEITNTTIAPDGISRIALLVNGQMPGPLIEANWGDTVQVTVINKMQDNGTTIHFHGIRQHYNNQYDGVPSVTQCPIPPGESMTYTWVAELYGSSWWHSHYAIQTWEGVFGPIVIHGPSSSDRQYDVDAGHVMLQDWSHWTVDSQLPLAEDATRGHNGGARVMDNGLINGMNTWGKDGSFNQTGERFRMSVTKGKSYLLRVINVSIQSTFKFYIDGHSLTVISTDFTPIVPYDTKILNINIGERYDVIVNADQEVSDYWMRSDNQITCSGNKQALDIKAIFCYEGSNGSTPTTAPYQYDTECTDEDHTLHLPIVPFEVSPPDVTWYGDVSIGQQNGLFRWFISGNTFRAKWDDPTVLGILDDGIAPNYSGNLLIDAPNRGEWIYVVVESGIPLPHPLHLHGHDFFILATGTGSYDAGAPLRLENPSRRDTVLMPGSGFVVVAWRADNPGAWLMHCHVGWHNAMGFAAQVVELQDQIVGTWDDDGCDLRNMCAAWDSWSGARELVTSDSGV
ncbi:extracellular dihydrogeodin oxidase laccase [Diplodia corticola]|uniref:Extracellular dihydrogeodin oxidase laccase n=1 Tax=Diplodia corticola TaxID=236234 RepID=A0A1J9QPC4_9PEZI|nr:extracellular dihydrogeodin oxidase laccase [Diplodia corticola]OJD30305.1 extracellular dihydrogeodin oxidase laccase [Diplodia corticola]